MEKAESKTGFTRRNLLGNHEETVGECLVLIGLWWVFGELETKRKLFSIKSIGSLRYLSRLTFKAYWLRDIIWYNMIWYDMIWYNMIWYDMIWYDIIYIISYMIWYMTYNIWYMVYDIWYVIYDMIWYI
jgi:hypothetical protein